MNDKTMPVVFLAFANNKEDNVQYLRNLTKELNQIREELKGLAQAGLCEVVERANVNLDNLFDVFQDTRYRGRIKIFHYGGHANSYQLLLEDSEGRKAEIDAENLNEFLSKQGVQLLFLNACCTELHAKQLLGAGVPAVIATSEEINDVIATQLAARFYHAIANHIPLNESFEEAISFVNAQNKSKNIGSFYRRDLQNKPATSLWQIYFQKDNEEIKGKRLLLPPIDISYHNSKILTILVLTTNRDKISKSNDLTLQTLSKGVHQDKASQWKPYLHEEEIAVLMDEYKQESRFHVVTHYIEDIWLSKLNQDKKLKLSFKNDVVKKIILLVDGFALHFTEYAAFAKLFDTISCGGLIVPICQQHDANAESFIRTQIANVFEELHTYYYEVFDKQCINLELEVPTKRQLFRRLTNLAVKNLGMSEIAGRVIFPPNIETQRDTILIEKSY